MKKNWIPLLIVILITISCEAVFVENISNRKIEIISPQNNVELSDKEVVFSWKNLNDTDNYRLKVVTPNFKNATKLVLDTIITSTSFKINLETGDYQWNIIGQNSEYQTQEAVNTFTIN